MLSLPKELVIVLVAIGAVHDGMGKEILRLRLRSDGQHLIEGLPAIGDEAHRETPGQPAAELTKHRRRQRPHHALSDAAMVPVAKRDLAR
jgi:hypothetical protein